MINKLYEKFKKILKENYKFLIFLIFIIVLFNYELPFVIYKSGGIINLEKRIEIDKDYVQDGSFSMTYVSALKGILPFMALSYVIPDWDVIPLKEITNEKDYDSVIEEGKVYLNEGIDNAIIAAFKEANYGLTITKTINTVVLISNEAKTDIVEGDILISVDDIEISNLDELKNYVNTLKENDKAIVKVVNNNKEYERYAYVYKADDETLKIGVALKTAYEYETEIPVKIKMKNNESGSSGGLMMSLQIYNALTKEDITKGLKIAGTGSITSDGNVLEIGGVKYKVLGASKKKADIFFCPEENYDEAMKIKKKRKLDIEIVKVSTLKEAIEYLNSL